MNWHDRQEETEVAAKLGIFIFGGVSGCILTTIIVIVRGWV